MNEIKVVAVAVDFYTSPYISPLIFMAPHPPKPKLMGLRVRGLKLPHAAGQQTDMGSQDGITMSERPGVMSTPVTL